MILAIETSTDRGSLALRDGEVTLAQCTFCSDRSHNSLIFAPLGDLLEQAGTSLRLIVAGTGPGSYTGVRIGISAAIGVSLARNVPLIGLPSVAALPGTRGHPSVTVCGDARRGSWWCAELRGSSLMSEPHVSTPGEISARIAGLSLPVFTADRASPPFCEAAPGIPDAAMLAERAAALSPAECAALAAKPLEPVYLRPPFITVSTRWKTAPG